MSKLRGGTALLVASRWWWHRSWAPPPPRRHSRRSRWGPFRRSSATTLSGIFRDVPLKYLHGDRRLREQGDPEGAGRPQPPAQRPRGREGMGSGRRAHAGVSRPVGDRQGAGRVRTADEALVYEWFQGLYKDQQIAQAQAAVDQYLDWSGLTEQTITLDPIPLEPTGTGYCSFRPPKALDGGIGPFNETYNPTLLPQCNGTPGLKVNSARGCQPAVRSRGPRSNSSSSGAGTSRSSRFSKAR